MSRVETKDDTEEPKAPTDTRWTCANCGTPSGIYGHFQNERWACVGKDKSAGSEKEL